MYKIILLAILTTTSLSCSVKPEPLNFGKDNCYACKMTLMDKKFGAEIVTKKGKVYKFDDVNCFINFKNSGYEGEENIANYLVVDFAETEKLIDAKSAHYCKSDQIKSPMASQVAAFGKKEDCESHSKEWNGVILDWEELTTLFK